MKTSKIKLILLGSLVFLSTHIAHAKYQKYPAGSERAQEVAELLIALYAQAPHDPTWLNIQFGAALAGISVDQASKLAVIPSPTAMMENLLSTPYTSQELLTVEPAIDRQMVIQSKIAGSCKLNGEMTQPTKTSYEFAVSCQIPVVDWPSFKKPAPNPKMSDAKNFIAMLNWVNGMLLQAPQKKLNTVIRIDQADNRLLPKITDENYFPVSLTVAISGVTQANRSKQGLRLAP